MKQQTFLTMNQIFKKAILFSFLGFFLAAGNNVVAQANQNVQNRTTFVFIDKTFSVEPDLFIQEKNNTWIKRIIKENVLHTGDKIILSFIYENTSSPTNKYVFTYTPPKQRQGRMSSSEARIAKVKYSKRLRAYNTIFTEKILTVAFSHAPNRSGTDVMGSIKFVYDFTSNNTANTYKIFYLSDMRECSDFRCLYCGSEKNKLNSLDHAQKLAHQDAVRLKEKLQLPATCLENISDITVLFPAKEMDANEAFSLLPTYWTSIFKAFGVTSINYH